MTIYFRVDASVELGAGHVMRCLMLAIEFRALGYKVEFVSRKTERDAIEFIESKGFAVHSLPYIEDGIWEFTKNYWKEDVIDTIDAIRNADVNLLIIDHYSIDEKWEHEIRPYVKKIMVIDDLANRKHDCDILLDQNFYLNYETRYVGKLNDNTLQLLGPKYALLRQEFKVARKSKKIDSLKRVLIFLGGADPSNETFRVVTCIEAIVKQYSLHVTIVIGQQNPNASMLTKYCEKHSNNFTLLIQVENMANLIYESNIVIGAAGITSLERIYLETPSLVISIAENQVQNAVDLNERNLLIYLGDKSEAYEKRLIHYLNYFIHHPNKLYDISRRCQKLRNQWGIGDNTWINCLL